MNHRFYAWDFGFMQTRFKCAGCGMKVPSLGVARKLERERCYG